MRDRRSATQGKGTAILIKKYFHVKQIISPEIERFKNLETVIISLNLPSNQKLYIIAANGERLNFNQEIDKLFKILQLDDLDTYFVMAGDLNAKHTSWLNETSNTRGNFLRKWIDDKQIQYKLELYSSKHPSYPRGNSYLDLCRADSKLQISKTGNSNKLETLEYDSDHKAIRMYISYKTKSDFLLEKSQDNHSLNYRKTN